MKKRTVGYIVMGRVKGSSANPEPLSRSPRRDFLYLNRGQAELFDTHRAAQKAINSDIVLTLGHGLREWEYCITRVFRFEETVKGE